MRGGTGMPQISPHWHRQAIETPWRVVVHGSGFPTPQNPRFDGAGCEAGRVGPFNTPNKT